jgi:predicted glycoside hydrolase/deacetylase ChbG (UPF0249 family)
MSGRWLIVNADDLGRTAAISEGVFEAHERGLVTSATLMVAYPAAAEAAREAVERHPRLGLGLHLQWSGGAPLLPPDAVPTLVDDAGRLPRRPDAGLAAAAPVEILAEGRAQLARFRELCGRDPTHLDSHHHAHRLPAVLDAVLRLAAEHALPVRAASAEVAEEAARRGVPTTDHFVESFYGHGATVETLERVLEELPPGVTELMCHPGHADDTLRGESAYSDEREREILVLTSPRLRRRIEALGMELAHFGDLARLRGGG